MTVCQGCGADNPAKKQFCSQCGQILPRDRRPQTGTDDMLGSVFGDRPSAESAPATTAPSNPQPAQRPPPTSNTSAQAKVADQDNAMADMSRAELLKTLAKAGTKAITKSLALSALVLGPGFVLLFMGQALPGMIWLFFGSFGLMAWSYRKPWRLGLIACLISPLAAGLAYLVQLWLFGDVMPPNAMLLLAISIGLLIGYIRARTHQVKQGDDGGIIAERTIGYLLIWVVAYGLTQAFAYFSINSLAVRAGLLTGAFSTAMLAMVSLVIWRQFQKLKRSVPTAMILALGLSGLGLSMPQSAQAQSAQCIEVRTTCKSAPGDKCGALDCMVKRYNACYGLHPVADDAKYALINDLKRDIARQGLSCSASGSGATSSSSSPSGNQGAAQTPSRTQPQPAPPPSQQVPASNGAQTVTERTPICFTINRKVIVLRGGDLMQKAMRCATSQTTCFDMRAQSYPDKVNCPWVTSPSQGASPGGSSPPANNASSSGDDSGGGFTPPNPLDGEPTSEEMQDAIVATTAAITAALIAAGIAANVAQAVAAAIAQAMQTGVQLTAEEIQEAITNALLGRPGSNQDHPGSEAADDPPGSNAPPNSPQTERFRPPAPVYDENGQPYKTDEDGNYLVPDRQGGYEPMSKAEAEKASAADREEKRQRQADRARHNRETGENLDRSSQTMGEKDDNTRADEQREKQETQARRDRVDADAQKEDPRTNPDSFPAEYGEIYQGTVFMGDWLAGMARDSQDLIDNAPGALVSAAAEGAKAGAKIVTDPENWKSAGRLGADVIGAHVGHQESRERLQSRIENAGKFVGKVVGHGIKTALDDPSGAAGAVVSTVLGKENWEKVVDPNVPVTERVGRALWGAVDTGGVVYSVATGAAGAAGKLGSALRAGDSIGDAARGAKVLDTVTESAKAADKSGDIAAAARATDKTVETGVAASKAEATANAANLADKSSGGAKAAGRKIGSSSDDAASLSSLDDAPGISSLDDAPPPRRSGIQDDLPAQTGGTDDAAKGSQRAAAETAEEAAETAEEIKNRSRNAISQMDDKIDDLKGQLEGMKPSDPAYRETRDRLAGFEKAREGRRTEFLAANKSRAQKIDEELKVIRQTELAGSKEKTVAGAKRQRELQRELDLLKQESRTMKSDHVAAQVNISAHSDDLMPKGLSRQRASFDVEPRGKGPLPKSKAQVEQAIQMHVDTQGKNSPYQSWTAKRQIAVSEGTRGYGGDQLAVAHIPRKEFERMVKTREVLKPDVVTTVTSRANNLVEQEVLVHRVSKQNWRVETPEMRSLLSKTKLPTKGGVPVFVDPEGNEFVILYRSMHKDQFPAGLSTLKS